MGREKKKAVSLPSELCLQQQQLAGAKWEAAAAAAAAAASTHILHLCHSKKKKESCSAARSRAPSPQERERESSRTLQDRIFLFKRRERRKPAIGPRNNDGESRERECKEEMGLSVLHQFSPSTQLNHLARP